MTVNTYSAMITKGTSHEAETAGSATACCSTAAIVRNVNAL